jgi:hypothetical protein
MKKTIYRTVIQLTVLSEEPLPKGMSLDEIDANCEDGDFCGKSEFIKTNEPLEGEDAVKAIEDTGSMTQFFQMDREGNEIDDIITGDAF